MLQGRASSAHGAGTSLACKFGVSTVRTIPTVEEVLNWYETQHTATDSPAQAVRERKRLWKLFRSSNGILSIQDCKPHVLFEWINRVGPGRAAWTRRRWNATIQRPFNFAAKLGLIDRNPFKGLTFPQGNDGRDWTEEEYSTLLRSCAPYVRRILVFIRVSGARPGEARLLDPSHVNMDAKAIILRKHKTFHRTKQPRRIPFNKIIIKLLSWLARHNPANAKKFFLNKWGRPWTCHALTKHLAKVRREAGLGDDVKVNGGRHTFATRAIMNGVDVATLAQLLGHASIATTNRYVHLAAKIPHLNAAMEQAVQRRNIE